MPLFECTFLQRNIGFATAAVEADMVIGCDVPGATNAPKISAINVPSAQ
jgi:hypothetical protein